MRACEKKLLSGKYEVQPRSAVNLRSMVLSAVDLIEELKRFDYQVLYAPAENFFLTSDCPVFSIQPDGKGKATVGSGFCRPNVELYFPLNKRTCWRMRNAIALSRKIVAKESLVAQINKMVMVTATQYVYSSQSHRRIARLFDERGCQVRAGKNAFLEDGETPTEM